MFYLKPNEEKILAKGACKVRALKNKVRQNILQVIESNGNRLNVTEIYTKSDLDQAVASQHLAILRDAELVKADKIGRTVFYTVDEAAVKRLLSACEAMN